MNKFGAAARISKLKNLINDYRYHYHVLDQSTMSEAAADSLKHELSALETEFPELITADSPTQRVAGEPLAKFTQVTHSSRMLSLNDVFNAAEVVAWVERLRKLRPAAASLEYFADIKMDGLMLFTLFSGVFGFTLVFVWLVVHRQRTMLLGDLADEQGLDTAILARQNEGVSD